MLLLPCMIWALFVASDALMLLRVLELKLKLILPGMVIAIGELQSTGTAKLVLGLVGTLLLVPLFKVLGPCTMDDERFLLTPGDECMQFVSELSKFLQGLVSSDNPDFKLPFGELFPVRGFAFAKPLDTVLPPAPCTLSPDAKSYGSLVLVETVDPFGKFDSTHSFLQKIKIHYAEYSMDF